MSSSVSQAIALQRMQCKTICIQVLRRSAHAAVFRCAQQMVLQARASWPELFRCSVQHMHQSYELREQDIHGWTLLYLAVRGTGGPRQCVILGSTFCPAQNLIENSKLFCSAELQLKHEQHFGCKQHSNPTKNLHRHRPSP